MKVETSQGNYFPQSMLYHLICFIMENFGKFLSQLNTLSRKVFIIVFDVKWIQTCNDRHLVRFFICFFLHTKDISLRLLLFIYFPSFYAVKSITHFPHIWFRSLTARTTYVYWITQITCDDQRSMCECNDFRRPG